MKFSQTERGHRQFFCCFQGGINNFSAASRGDKKFNRVFHPVSTSRPPAREVKNDNSLTLNHLDRDVFDKMNI